jgi:hypothetical protein
MRIVVSDRNVTAAFFERQAALTIREYYIVGNPSSVLPAKPEKGKGLGRWSLKLSTVD